MSRKLLREGAMARRRIARFSNTKKASSLREKSQAALGTERAKLSLHLSSKKSSKNSRDAAKPDDDLLTSLIAHSVYVRKPRGTRRLQNGVFNPTTSRATGCSHSRAFYVALKLNLACACLLLSMEGCGRHLGGAAALLYRYADVESMAGAKNVL
ncbi:hypothetical protein NDU88_004520 [Pleurodeles waltl]|uniref:Uncharacterized protein n=1 Tax=Pleurodeles waltl TaxID=8319 RepID=A0AAV7SJ62_PLEWA|nr:hypothetical protein NDU88_004520 [Pleurodeles waltl]